MDPVTALAAAELKRRLWRILRRVLAVVMPLLLVGALAMGVFTSALFAGDSSGDQENASLSCGLVARPAAVDIGSLDAEQLANTTMDRSGRLLRRVRMEDAEAAGRVFELLMGNEVAPRREFIIDSSDRLSRESIDA